MKPEKIVVALRKIHETAVIHPAARLGKDVEIGPYAVIGENVVIGSPVVAGATVEATVVSQGRHKKVRIFKMQRRKHYQRRMGHRQYYTELKIEAINN